jgi:hypothetical protein
MFDCGVLLGDTFGVEATKKEVLELVEALRGLQRKRDEHSDGVMRPEADTPEDLAAQASRVAEAYNLVKTKAWAVDHNTQNLQDVIAELAAATSSRTPS